MSQTLPHPTAGDPSDPDAIRPFTFQVTDEELADLRRRVEATRWPDRETDPTQGVRLDTIQALARYWATDYDWRAFERGFAALPHFVTRIDGVDIHFIHVRSAHEDALPLIVTHGWPGSTIEQLKIIGPLTDPTSHGGDAADAFHLVIPSLPGHGFSAKPTETGWDPVRIARAWAELMKRLGYERYVAQGGDWGNAVTEQLALLKPADLLGIHTNMPATVPPDVSKALGTGGPKPDGMSAGRGQGVRDPQALLRTGIGYAQEMCNRPQTLYALEDSPVGLAAWMIDHDERSYLLIERIFVGQAGTHKRRHPRQHHPLLADEVGGVVCAAVLGKPSGVLRHQGRRPSGRRDRLPGRDLSGSGDLGGEGLPQLVHYRRRRGGPFRRLGTAAGADRRAQGGIPLPPMTRDPPTAKPSRAPGLMGSIAHRLAGDAAELPDEGRLASFEGATGWLGSEPLTPDGLRGRVVLVDFWTYTCVNWLRTLPYLRAWATKYADRGLTIVGVHTPEFDFEHDLDNVIAMSGPGRRLPHRARQRLWGVARLLESLLAGGVHRRR